MFFEHADCLIGICKDVDTCSSQVLTLDLTKYDEVPQTNNAVDNNDDELVDQNATGHRHSHDDSHVVDGNERIVDYSPRGRSSNRDDDYEEGVVVASGGGSGGGAAAKGRGSTRSVKERRSSSSKRKSNESGSSKIYREVIVEETDADVAENDG